MTNFLAKLPFDLADIILVCGFILLGTGLWFYYPPLALMTIGALMILIWFVAYLRFASRGSENGERK